MAVAVVQLFVRAGVAIPKLSESKAITNLNLQGRQVDSRPVGYDLDKKRGGEQ